MIDALPPLIEDGDFRRLRDLVYSLSGIHLHDGKRALLTARVGKRLRQLGIPSFAAYYDRVQTDGAERVELVNCITTNKTDFFREPHHFELLRTRLIPELRARAARGAPRRLQIWSAGCSTGEEPYSIAMILRDHLIAVERGWDVRIIASDIDTAVLAHAERGIYGEDRLEALPEDLRRRHFLRGTGSCAGSWRVRPELRQLIDFQRINLTAGPWPFQELSDAIFCRNVIIYFDQPTQRRIYERFARQLTQDSYLFMGHSESMIGISTAFSRVGPTAYQLAAEAAEPVPRRLQIGELFASRTPARITTVLGSCISACLFDPVARVGGMNHFLLPAGDHDAAQPARYGVHAMELLINRVMELGGQRRRLEAKVVGASNVLHGLDGSVAEQNGRFVRTFLSTEGIPLIAERLGGTRPLEVQFLTATGQLRCREIITGSARAMAEREHRHRLAAQRLVISPAREVLFLSRAARVLVVDDSAAMRTLLGDVLGQGGLHVVGVAPDAFVAWEKIKLLAPDVLTLDVEMPGMDGLSFLEKLMALAPMPVVMVSAFTVEGCATTLRALELGAVDFVAKPRVDMMTGAVALAAELVEKVKAAAGARVRPRRPTAATRPVAMVGPASPHKVIAIGASAGGTEALRALLAALPADAPGVVVVQHMPERFTRAFAERLDGLCEVNVREAEDGDPILPGRVLIAPGDRHMKVRCRGATCSVEVLHDAPVNRHRPSVDVLFQSCAGALGKHGIGVIMTGMGADGARGLLAMREQGARTFAQDEASCVVFGMPRAAIACGAVEQVKPLDDLAAAVLRASLG